MVSLTEEKEKNMQKISLEMCRIALEKNLSDSICKKILAILKGETKLGREQSYQAVSRITDILNNSKSEEEIMQKLNEEYPTA